MLRIYDLRVRAALTLSAFALRSQRIEAARARLWPHRLDASITPPTTEKLADLKGRFKGRRCVIVGTGPSVSEIDLSLIKDDYVFLMNKAYTLSPRFSKSPEALVISDAYGFRDYGLEALSGDFSYKFMASVAPCIDLEDPALHVFCIWRSPTVADGFFQRDIRGPLYNGHTVFYLVLQIAAYMGFATIITAGIDFPFDSSHSYFYEAGSKEVWRGVNFFDRMRGEMIKGLPLALWRLRVEGVDVYFGNSKPRSNDIISEVRWGALF